MSKTVEPQPARRASYVEPHPDETPPDTGKIEPVPEPSEELKQTIAATRAAQVADLQLKLEAETHRADVADAGYREAQALIDAKNEAIENMGVELTKLQDANRVLAEGVNGVTTEVYEYTQEEGNDTYTVVQIDTEEATKKIRVYVNDGEIFYGDPEEKDRDNSNGEESAADTFFKAVEYHLSIHDGGAQEILKQIEAKSPIERAAFIRGIRTLVDVMQANTHNLADLAQRSEIAVAMVEG